jgi:hypothetical protein
MINFALEERDDLNNGDKAVRDMYFSPQLQREVSNSSYDSRLPQDRRILEHIQYPRREVRVRAMTACSLREDYSIRLLGIDINATFVGPPPDLVEVTLHSLVCKRCIPILMINAYVICVNRTFCSNRPHYILCI